MLLQAEGISGEECRPLEDPRDPAASDLGHMHNLPVAGGHLPANFQTVFHVPGLGRLWGSKTFPFAMVPMPQAPENRLQPLHKDALDTLVGVDKRIKMWALSTEVPPCWPRAGTAAPMPHLRCCKASMSNSKPLCTWRGPHWDWTAAAVLGWGRGRGAGGAQGDKDQGNGC